MDTVDEAEAGRPEPVSDTGRSGPGRGGAVGRGDVTDAAELGIDGTGSDGLATDVDGSDADTAAAAMRAEHARSVYALAAAMLRWGTLLASPVALATVGVATLTAGSPGLVGAGFGVVLGFGSSLVTITMMRIAATRPPTALMGVAMGGYAVKMSGLLLVMLLLRDVSSISRPALALGMLVVVVAWAAAEIVAFTKTKTPTIVVARSAESVD